MDLQGIKDRITFSLTCYEVLVREAESWNSRTKAIPNIQLASHALSRYSQKNAAIFLIWSRLIVPGLAGTIRSFKESSVLPNTINLCRLCNLFRSMGHFYIITYPLTYTRSLLSFFVLYNLDIQRIIKRNLFSYFQFTFKYFMSIFLHRSCADSREDL